MILYHAISTYQLLNFMIYHAANHPDEEATLLLSEDRARVFPHWEQLHRYFKEIRLISIAPIERDHYSEHAVLEWGRAYCSGNGIDLKSFSRIYVGCAHFAFGLYLCYEKIPFFFLEDAAGLMSAPDILENVDRKTQTVKVALCLEQQLYDGLNPLIRARIGNEKAQRPGFNRDRFQPFDVLTAFRSLGRDDQDFIKHFFVSIDSIHVPDHAVLMLTQHYSLLGTLPYEEQVLIDQMTMDFFFAGYNLLFKPHPDDWLDYVNLFPGCQVIRERFPSELMPLLLDQEPAVLATITSTAIGSLKPYFAHSFQLNTAYEKEFHSLPCWDCALDLAAGLTDKRTITAVGCNTEALRALADAGEHHSDGWTLTEGSLQNASGIVFLDDAQAAGMSPEEALGALQDLPQDTVVFLPNTCGRDSFFPQTGRLPADMLPVRLSRTRVRETEYYGGTEPQTFWVFTKDKTVRARILAAEWHKQLPYEGLEVHKDMMTEKDIEIASLKGQLAAMERRMTRLIEENKALKEAEADRNAVQPEEQPETKHRRFA